MVAFISTVCVCTSAFAQTQVPLLQQQNNSDVQVSSDVEVSLNQTGQANVIVTLKDYEIAELDSKAVRSELKSEQARVIENADLDAAKTYSRIPAISTTVDYSQLEQLRSDPNVDSITLSRYHKPAELKSSNQFLESINLRPSMNDVVTLMDANDAWNNSPSYTGSGERIAIIDTGVQSSHPFLSGSVVLEACFAQGPNGSASGGDCPNGLDSQTGTGAGAPCTTVSGCNHGTHVAGIAAGRRNVSGAPVGGVAPSASVIAIQVFTTFESTDLVSPGVSVCESVGSSDPCILTSDSDVLSALNYVIANRTGVASVNLSLGGGGYSQNCDLDSPTVATAISTLRSYGILSAVASGNDGNSAQISWPACISSAVAVGSVSKADVVASYSNSNSLIDIWGTGGVSPSSSAILSSVPTTLDVDGTVDGYTRKIGTSMASPTIAGAIALLRDAYPSESATQILSRLQSSGVNVTDSRNGVTKKRPSVIQAIQMASPSNTELVRTVSNASVYLINGDYKHPIPSIGVFNEFSTLGSVRFVEQSYLDSIPTGSNLSRVVGSTTDSSVYLIIAGIRLLFPSCDLVVDFGYSCSNLILFSPTTLNRFVSGPAVTVYFRSVTDATVYFIDNGYKRPIASWADLVSLGFPIAIHRFSDLFLNSITTGDLMLGGGSLLKVASSSSVYAVNNWSGTPSVFPVTSFANTVDLGLGTNVRTVSASEFSKYSVGSNLRTSVKCGGLTYFGINGTLYRVDPSQYTHFGVNDSSFLVSGDICNRFVISPDLMSRFIVNSGSIFLVENGTKRGFTSFGAYLAAVGSSTPVVVSNSFAGSLPNGSPISS